MNSVALTESLYDQKLIVYAFSTMRANEKWIMSQKTVYVTIMSSGGQQKERQ